MRPLVWFRSDLRTRDNAALASACRAADRGVVAVFTICPRQWRLHDWGDARVEFLLRNLACLAERLKKLQIALRFVERPTFAGVPAALLALARDLQCDGLYFSREYEVNEARRDEAITRAFERDGRQVHAFDDSVILAPDTLCTGGGEYYRVFTPYRRKWLATVASGAGGALAGGPRAQPEPVCAADPVPARVTDFALERGRPDLWPAGEGIALQRLAEFVATRLEAYHGGRNLPGHDGTSRLSPYLAHGVLSPRRCLAEAQAANDGALDGGREGPGTWITELIWREFYRHVLIGFPRVSMGRAFQPATERVAWRADEAGFQAWCDGRTGYPLIDAGMRQLAATGWMHNRLRMAVAMFLSKNLLIDWRRGERHFMQHLVDGDLPSNSGGWQWAASTGTDAVPYFRVFNPWLQAKRFDREGECIRRWVPELRELSSQVLHDPARLAKARADGLRYAEPVCDYAASRKRAIAAFAATGGDSSWS